MAYAVESLTGRGCIHGTLIGLCTIIVLLLLEAASPMVGAKIGSREEGKRCETAIRLAKFLRLLIWTATLVQIIEIRSEVRYSRREKKKGESKTITLLLFCFSFIFIIIYLLFLSTYVAQISQALLNIWCQRLSATRRICFRVIFTSLVLLVRKEETIRSVLDNHVWLSF